METQTLLCIGHRGAMGHKPENTLVSIRKAIELGAPCVEIDVYHVDGRLVVFHDDRLERTTNGKGVLAEQSFDYLRSLDAGDGERIPTLEEVCSEVHSRAGLNIELKGPGTAGPVAELVRRLCQEGHRKDRFLVSSFDRHALVEMGRLDPQIKLGVLLDSFFEADVEFALDLGAFSVHPCVEHVHGQLVKASQAKGLKVYVYTVDRSEDIVRMAQLGADGVFTNFPERVLEKYRQPDIDTGWS